MTDRKVTLSITKDGGHTWGDHRERSLGEQGDYTKRVVVNRLGMTREAAVKVRVTSPIKATILAASAQITVADR